MADFADAAGWADAQVISDLLDYYGEKTGRIGLQVHVGPSMKAEFRDVQVKELR